jgi:uncharacterized membrane protein
MADLGTWLKLIHILSATLLFGTGLGTAFFMWRADKAGDVAAIAVTARHVVLADLLFTTPAVIVQPATGIWLALERGYDFSEGWLHAAIALYILTGACWLPVVWLQAKMRDMAEAARQSGAALPARYHRFMRLWFILGWPAFAAVLAIFVLMLFRPEL